MTDPRPLVLHLVDDATPGGVTRVLDQIRSCTLMARDARHEVRPVSRKGGLPRVQADLIVSHLAISWRSLPALISFRARHSGTPLVHVEHSYTEGFTALNVPFKARFFTLLRTAYALFDRVVAVSAPQANWLARRGLVRSDVLQVITPVVDLSAFRALNTPQGPALRIGAIGRLHRQKGFDTLIDAVRSLPQREISLHIHGTGEEEAALKARAAGDPRIVFHGHSEDPAAVMSHLDIVAMPSRWEAFGLVALEARAAGRPIVASGVDGLSQSAGPQALIVSTPSAEAWAAALSARLKRGSTPGAMDRCATAEREFAAAWGQLLADLAAPQELHIAA
ncbi:glycosyl transferase [Thioclava dalianensis]|uniref:Glycosyl transferase n=1 Tax=Thioclava dalianensis TaxID=1185766 RepID=A0A074TQB9_9RHOB|nr:glycosyltransferase [Thioclava dalianensis]KEP71188.1 glycosyl transferase [Thioclava dalianensis]SFN23120.1 Glycosyltransferase involved in cell wall bisynthesis [Thioclava dalianensis]